MTLEQLKVLIKASNKIFVWVRLSTNCGAYLNISKSTLSEYLGTLETYDDFAVELDEVGDLYLGNTTSEDS